MCSSLNLADKQLKRKSGIDLWARIVFADSSVADVFVIAGRFLTRRRNFSRDYREKREIERSELSDDSARKRERERGEGEKKTNERIGGRANPWDIIRRENELKTIMRG